MFFSWRDINKFEIYFTSQLIALEGTSGFFLFCFNILILNLRAVSVQFSSVAQLCQTLCDPMNRSTPGLPVHHQLLEFTQTGIHQVSDTIHPSHPLSSPSPPAPNPSQHQSLSNESTLFMWWPKYWSFSFSIIPSKEIPGPIYFRMHWLDLLAVEGTVKSLFQHHSSKASILWRSAFFRVLLSSIHDNLKNHSLN